MQANFGHGTDRAGNGLIETCWLCRRVRNDGSGFCDGGRRGDRG